MGATIRACVVSVGIALLVVSAAGCSPSGAPTPAEPTSANQSVTIDAADVTIAFTAEDAMTCRQPAITERIDAARSSDTESPDTSPLALPQALAEQGLPAEEVLAQVTAWGSLSQEERQFQLCFNAAEGAFDE